MGIHKVKVGLFGFYILLMFLFALGNTTDFSLNFAYVKHVISMDTTQLTTSFRAIHHHAVHYIAFLLIVGWQYLTALVGCFGVFRYCRSRDLRIMNLSLFMGITLYFFGFLCIASEWFLMWQSQVWNGQDTAVSFTVLFVSLLIFINMPILEEA